MTPLGVALAQEIARDGPIGVDRFMAACLGDPTHGYYTTRDPLGEAGDFVTAPEISQVFGEIVGLVLADCWLRLGAPEPVALVELGPGRGTLMADLWRSWAGVPALRRAAEVHLVETSPVLRGVQARTLGERHPGLAPRWHERIDTVPDGPLLLIANEFFDALPIGQAIRTAEGWRRRRIGLGEAGALRFVAGERVSDATDDASLGAVREDGAAARAVAAAIGARLARHAGLALIVDYGHARPGFGDTLQAVRGHRPADVLAEPGLADLTAHVDFTSLRTALEAAGAVVWGPIGQGRFLAENGVALREAALTRGKAPDEATSIRQAIARLISADGMGRLFKVLAAGGPGSTPPAGFAQ